MEKEKKLYEGKAKIIYATKDKSCANIRKQLRPAVTD